MLGSMPIRFLPAVLCRLRSIILRRSAERDERDVGAHRFHWAGDHGPADGPQPDRGRPLPRGLEPEEVAVEERGIIAGAHEGLVHIDMSTISPAVTRAIAGRYAEAGIEMLDAPVSGGEQGAIEGTLSIMAGGRQETFERCRAVLEVLGRKLVYCGPSGSGQVVKLCNQVVVGLNNLAMGEALVLDAKAGVDPATMVDAVSAGAGASWALDRKST